MKKFDHAKKLTVKLLFLLAGFSLVGCVPGAPPGQTEFVAGSTAPNTLPFAEAGENKGIITGQSITLDGSNSLDADGDTLSYNWSIYSAPETSNASLTQRSSSKSQFIPDADGQYILSLVVNDNVDGSSIDFVTITASTSGNTPPVCNIAPNLSASTGSAFTLNNVANDNDNDNLSYLWTLESIPDQSTTSLTSETIKNPSLTPDVDGEYYLSLTVNDATHDSQPCLTVISSSANPNARPFAHVGDGYGVFTDKPFDIDGSASFDPDSSTLTYEWLVINAPPGSTATITNPTAAITGVHVDMDGFYVIKLTVNDGISTSKPALILIEASSTAEIPQTVVTAFASICLAP